MYTTNISPRIYRVDRNINNHSFYTYRINITMRVYHQPRYPVIKLVQYPQSQSSRRHHRPRRSITADLLEIVQNVEAHSTKAVEIAIAIHLHDEVSSVDEVGGEGTALT